VIIVQGQAHAPPGDPFEQLNAKSFEVVQDVDKAFVAPLAKAYEKALPTPLRDGLRNFLRNLDEPIVAANFLLQLKPHAAVRTVARFAVNSTIGVAGLIDIAKERPVNLPYRPNGFANTMGYYGVKPGPYMFLPIIGPTTLRDVVGLGLDRGFVPTIVGAPFNNRFYAVGATVIRSLDYRVECDATLRSLHEESSDPYAATRAYYLATRQAEIEELHGRKLIGAPPACGTRAVRSAPTALIGAPADTVPVSTAQMAGKN
jgi:phospholipid-binding lipoprotein MlaA